MRHYQCLFYGLDKWHTEGGYLQFRKSSHWCVPHVLHEDVNGQLTHFVPRADLRHAKKSLFGFSGEVQYTDTTPAKRMSMGCMLIGTLLLLFGGGVWAVKTIIQKLLRPIP